MSSELWNATPANASVEISEMMSAQMVEIPEVRVLFYEFTEFSFLSAFSAFQIQAHAIRSTEHYIPFNK